jgi:hypothetical protein
MRDVGTQGAQLLQLQHELSDFPLRLLQGVVLPTICNAGTARFCLSYLYLSLKTHTTLTTLTLLPCLLFCLSTANGNGALWVYVLTLLDVIAKRMNNKSVFISLTKAPLAKGLHLINPVETMQAFIRYIILFLSFFLSSYA